jgi:hypothetical protein
MGHAPVLVNQIRPLNRAPRSQALGRYLQAGYMGVT